jgi:peptidoglycan/xylan/chitin deacetylase (PgdA/CDA1 family)
MERRTFLVTSAATALSGVAMTPLAAQAKDELVRPWPYNCKAAVSVTYDDGWDSQLDVAIPDLEDRGLRGTFFITPKPWASRRPGDWRAACRRGHEIANHTWDHSDECRLLPSYSSERFSAEETGMAEQWLDDNIGLNGIAGKRDPLRTYAYICGDEKLGPGNEMEARARYLALVQKTFWAARSGGGGPTTRSNVLANPHQIAAGVMTYGYPKADRSIDFCNQALQINGWAVLVFHNIVDGNPRSETDTTHSVHREVLDHLAQNQDKFWVAPFRDVYRQIRSGG